MYNTNGNYEWGNMDEIQNMSLKEDNIYPFETKIAPIESWGLWLSIGASLVSNGAVKVPFVTASKFHFLSPEHQIPPAFSSDWPIHVTGSTFFFGGNDRPSLHQCLL